LNFSLTVLKVRARKISHGYDNDEAADERGDSEGIFDCARLGRHD
jgi:hypothetical protein